jgi:hypothetical protein
VAARTNGKVTQPTIHRLGDLTPERRPCCSVERDGKEVILEGLVENDRVPGTVRIALAGAYQDMQKRIDEGDSNTGALIDYTRTVLLTIIPGLEWNEADVIAATFERSDAILKDLGWRSEDTEAGSPEAQGEAPTGELSSPS